MTATASLQFENESYRQFALTLGNMTAAVS